MVFGLFTRKSTLDASPEIKSDARLPTPTPTPSITGSVIHHSPLRTVLTIDAESAPPPTPSPVDTKTLHDLILTVPPKTLHAYTLAHLGSPLAAPALGLDLTTPRPPSPPTLSKLTSFFSTLAPPPHLHCVRCHKDFYEVENEEKDKACRVAHDDDSALVSRVSGSSGGGYETLWGCCGQTTPGDGSEGPPDGWCYEGRHTTDVRRARFRTDSTIHDDKLTSCLKLNCHGVRDRLPRPEQVHTSPSASGSYARKSNPSPARSQASALTRKRPRKSLKEVSGSENEADAESVVSAKGKGKNKDKDQNEDGDRDKAKDEARPKSKSRPVKSQPISRARPLASTSTPSPQKPESAAKTTPGKRIAGSKPKSRSRTLLSQSQTHLASDSEASTRSRPRTRSHVREESRSRPPSKLAAPKRTRRTAQVTSEEERETEETDQERRGRDRKRRRVARD